jgi:hypothetical protein
MLMGDSSKARLSQRSGVVWKVGGAKTGEDAKGEVEASDEQLRGETHDAVRNAEV